MARSTQAPSYDHHRCTYARVIINRKSIHLGKYDFEVSHQKYREAIAVCWWQNQKNGRGSSDGVHTADDEDGAMPHLAGA